MTLEEFKNLTTNEKLDKLFALLTKQDGPNYTGLFTGDRPTPVYEAPRGPLGFSSVFGDFPENAPYGSAERISWENKVKRWGGLYDLINIPEHLNKKYTAVGANLGRPIGYVFDGNVFVTFEKLKGLGWYRDLSQYINNYDEIVNAANLEARQKGLI